MPVIKSYSDAYKQKWDDYVMNSDNSTLFHLTGWKDAVEKCFGHKSHYCMAVRNEEICGILPMFEMKSLFFGHALVSVPFGVYGGISAIDSDTYRALNDSAEIMTRLIGADYLELRNKESGSNGFPAANQVNGDAVLNWKTKNLYVAFERALLTTEEENFHTIPRKQRRMIRQGMKYGLNSSIAGIEHLKEFYSIYARNVRDLGSPVFPITFFEELMGNFRDSFILSVWKDKKMVAGVLTFLFKNTIMPYYGGGSREYFDYAINDFMYWELMKYGSEKGYKTFDFGRSKKDSGPFHFKRHWGFEPKQLDYQFYLPNSNKMPNVSPTNPKYRLFINLWKSLPLPVTNWLGPKLVRGIP